jgi:hypothetical protein
MNQLTTERIADGYKVTFSEELKTPELFYNGTKWLLTHDWAKKLDSSRETVITLLYNSRANLFKNSPSQKTLENLLCPWVVMSEDGNISCDLPLPNSTKDGKGNIVISGLIIKQSGITPTWKISSYTENTPVVDFDWNDTSSVVENELREITLIESELPYEDTADTLKLNTDDEYNARKFAAKERVKEARLKAILARRAAEVETTRYYMDFTSGDNESTFSEYDISDFDEEESEKENNSEA